MKNHVYAALSCYLLLPALVHAAEMPSLSDLFDNYDRDRSSRSGAVLFKHCAAFNNALLNAYKDNAQQDDELVDTVEQYSLITATHVEIASVLTVGIGRDDVEDVTAALDAAIDTPSSNSVNIFDLEYYELLRFYTGAVQNAALITVQIDRNTSAFVSSLNEPAELCNAALSTYCDLDSLAECVIL